MNFSVAIKGMLHFLSWALIMFVSPPASHLLVEPNCSSSLDTLIFLWYPEARKKSHSFYSLPWLIFLCLFQHWQHMWGRTSDDAIIDTTFCHLRRRTDAEGTPKTNISYHRRTWRRTDRWLINRTHFWSIGSNPDNPRFFPADEMGVSDINPSLILSFEVDLYHNLIFSVKAHRWNKQHRETHITIRHEFEILLSSRSYLSNDIVVEQ